MIVWGWSGMSHDASLAVFSKSYNRLELLFAGHSERYSRIKNDKNINAGILQEALEFGEPNRVHFYERPLLKKTRQLWAGQYNLLRKETPWNYLMNSVGSATTPFVLPRMKKTSHHCSHAAAGYYTSPFTNAAILCIDSIGEWETLTIWSGTGRRLTKKFSQSYPHSVGIWYSAMTQRIGLKPQEHEYILMGMAAVGDPSKYYKDIRRDFIAKMPSVDDPRVVFKENLHRGCRWWREDLTSVQDYADIAAAVQRIYEEIFSNLVAAAAKLVNSKNIVLMGGCALNCVANSIARTMFDNVWIMPNPGDAGSSIGAVLAHERRFLPWMGAYLGHNIEGEYPVDDVVEQLLTKKITAVAAGRAEFGPRSLGHRSILADPRGADVKDRVNQIKKREAFRPFAPMILQEHANEYFEYYHAPGDIVAPYMQMTVKCKRPDLFPAIVHYDDSSRLQTVSETDCPDVYRLLKTWYHKTGCPMLLNTSLNVKGEPLVNTRADAERWAGLNGVDVCLPK